MKTIGRILIILLATTVVVGATWALTRNGVNAQFAPGEGRFRPDGDFGGEELFPEQPPQGLDPGQRPEGFREGVFERAHRGDFFLFGWLRNIGIIAVIVAVVVFAESLWNHRRINQAVKTSMNGPQTK